MTWEWVAPVTTGLVGVVSVAATSLVAWFNAKAIESRDRRAEQMRRIADYLAAQTDVLSVVGSVSPGEKSERLLGAIGRLSLTVSLLYVVVPASVADAASSLFRATETFLENPSEQAAEELARGRQQFFRTCQASIGGFHGSDLLRRDGVGTLR